DVFYAQRGYAVVTYSARGFGRSCGTPASRTAGCSRGWTHLFDQRFEARDTQYLLGVLVDEGIAQAGALGVTGVSGGSAQALELAYLRNRVRLPDGRFALWRSPAGRRLSIGAAARAVARQLTQFHSTSPMGGIPAPLLVQNGWADDVFPAREALRVYNAVRSRNAGPGAPISLQLLDTGHSRGGAHLDQERAANDQAAAFFDAYLRGRGRPPRAGSVLAITQAC